MNVLRLYCAPYYFVRYESYKLTILTTGTKEILVSRLLGTLPKCPTIRQYPSCITHERGE